MQERVIYFGPPGTGKTTRLLEHVRDELELGTDPSQIAFVAFSRKAAREARDRATAELGLTGEDVDHWRTLHSTAARQLGARPGELVTGEHWDALGDMLDMRFAEPDEAGRVAADWGYDRGRRVQSAYSLRRATRAPLDLASLVRDYGETDGLLVDLFARTLDAYKQTRGLMDYSDLLDRAPGHLPVEVAFIDEAQDLTPAQWDYALRLVADARAVYVAGDDDQAIFDWAGADVRRFLELDGERRVLDLSHRLPRSVYARAAGILGRIAVRQPKEWRPSDRDGTVDVVTEPDHVDVTTGDWLLLGRTRGLLDRWEAVCRLAGVRYVRQGRDSVRPGDATSIRAWETARRGQRVAAPVLAPALELAGIDIELAEDHTYSLTDLGFAAAPVWSEAMIRIPEARRLYYRECLRRDSRALTDPARVTISTVHGAKGGEATSVGLLTDVTPRIDESSRRRPDPEHRVWYVAATRARERLVIVRPTTDLGYAI